MTNLTGKKSSRIMFARIVCAMSCMLILLLSPAAALNGAAYGLALWYRTLFPTLMPFMVLSNFIVYTGCAKPIGVLLAPLTKLLHLPAASGYCILIGFVCGYPMGAYVCGCLNETGTIDDDTAMLLAPVCNNVSPMFMISYICMSCLGDKALSGTVICLLIGSAFAGMFVLRYWGWIKKQHGRRKISSPADADGRMGHRRRTAIQQREDTEHRIIELTTSEALSHSVENALTASLKLCIYVMLFSTAGAMIGNIKILPDIAKAVLISLMEITAGLDKISELNIEYNYKILLMLTATAFGGMSSVFQTMSLWSGRRFSVGRYMACKICIACITALEVLFLIITGIL